MTRYSETKEFDFSPQINGQARSITVKANGGSVTVYAWNGVEYVETGDLFTADGSYPLFTSNMKLQVVPAGGATYSWSN